MHTVGKAGVPRVTQAIHHLTPANIGPFQDVSVTNKGFLSSV